MNIGSVRWTFTCYALIVGGATLTCISMKVLANEIKRCIQ